MGIFSSSRALAVAAVGIVMASSPGFAAETLKMGGTGAATEMLRQLGTTFAAKTESKIEIVPSLGSSGGLQALQEGAIDVAVSGRELRPEEKAKGLTAAFAFRSPYVLATSHPKPNGLRSSDIAAIFASKLTTWADGAPIRIILRPKSESDTKLLGDLFPGASAAIDQARLRPDVPVAATDQDNADMAERIRGSFIGATFTQLQVERRPLRTVAIDGIEPTLENFESGKYPYGKTLYLVLPANASPASQRFIAYLQSPEGRAALRETGNLPAAN